MTTTIADTMPDTPQRAPRRPKRKIPTRIYSYGCFGPDDIASAQAISAEMFRNFEYENNIRGIERHRHTTEKELLHEHAPELDGLETAYMAKQAEYRALEQEIGRLNSARRKRACPPEARELATRLKAEHALAKQTYFARLKEVRAIPDVSMRLSLLKQEGKGTHRQTRGASGIHWGSYQMLDKRVEMSIRARWKRAVDHGVPYTPPRIKHWEGTGTIAIHFQGDHGPTMDRLFSGTYGGMHIVPFPDGFNATPRGQRATIVEMRLGDTANKAVVRFKVKLHRLPPPDAEIRWAKLFRIRIGGQFKWKFQLVVTHPTEFQKFPDKQAAGSVGIDVGWRTLDDGSVRVAVCRDEADRVRELVIPERYVQRWAKVAELRGTRADNYNLAVAQLRAFLGSGVEIPEWLQQRTATIAHWKVCQRRLAALVNTWRGGLYNRETARWSVARFPGDELILATLEAWRQQDQHLWAWEAQQSKQVVRWRDWLYRLFLSCSRTAAQMQAGGHDYSDFIRDWVRDANGEWVRCFPDDRPIGLAYRYVSASVEELRLLKMRKTPSRFDNYETHERDRIMKNADVASVGRFLELTGAAMSVTTKNPPEWTTQRCHVCKAIEPFDKKELWHTCSQCGARWDQDFCAAANIRDLGLGTLRAPGNYADEDEGYDEPDGDEDD